MDRSRARGGYVAREYCDQVGKNPVLTRKEEADLSQRIEQGDQQARERLICCNLKLVASVANKFAARCPEVLPDLIQEGTLGLMKAVEDFEWQRGFKFSTYARYWIVKFILLELKRKHRASPTESLSSEHVEQCSGYFTQEAGSLWLQAETINYALAKLDFREQQVVCMRFGLQGCTPCTSREVAEKIGISFSAVNRINKGALEKMRRNKEMRALR